MSWRNAPENFFSAVRGCPRLCARTNPWFRGQTLLVLGHGGGGVPRRCAHWDAHRLTPTGPHEQWPVGYRDLHSNGRAFDPPTTCRPSDVCLTVHGPDPVQNEGHLRCPGASRTNNDCAPQRARIIFSFSKVQLFPLRQASAIPVSGTCTSVHLSEMG